MPTPPGPRHLRVPGQLCSRRACREEHRLRQECRKLVNDPADTELLDDVWQEHQSREGEQATRPTSVEGSPSALREERKRAMSLPDGQPRTRNRAVSTTSALAPPGQTLSLRHPALSLSTYLDTFGPLVFPLYKAALLRKRVLLLGHAPVELACHFGDLSYPIHQ